MTRAGFALRGTCAGDLVVKTGFPDTPLGG